MTRPQVEQRRGWLVFGIVTGALLLLGAAFGAIGGWPAFGLWLAGFAPVVHGAVQLVRRRTKRGLVLAGSGLLAGMLGLAFVPQVPPATTASPADSVAVTAVTASPESSVGSATAAPHATTPKPKPSTPKPSVEKSSTATASVTTPSTTMPSSRRPTTTKPSTTQPPSKKPPTRPSSKKPPVDQGGDRRYSTCKEAKAHGLGPYHRGKDPEYHWYQDRDHDGIVCE